MKKRFTYLASIAFTFLFAASMAPDAHAQELEYGVKGGLSLATLRIDADGADLGSRTGFAAGGFLRTNLGPISLQPELLYVQKGASQEFETANGSEETTLSLGYIELPVLARFEVPLSGAPVAPALFAGPAPAFKISESDDDDVDDEEDEFTSFDLGLAFGGGLDFDAGGTTLTVDARYTLGLLDVADSEGDDAPSVNNGAFLVTVGVLF